MVSLQTSLDLTPTMQSFKPHLVPKCMVYGAMIRLMSAMWPTILQSNDKDLGVLSAIRVFILVKKHQTLGGKRVLCSLLSWGDMFRKWQQSFKKLWRKQLLVVISMLGKMSVYCSNHQLHSVEVINIRFYKVRMARTGVFDTFI